MALAMDSGKSSTESQWYYTREELALPPSVRADMPLHEERALRQRAVYWLWAIRDKSSFKQPVITAAATFVHRFYMRETFQDWDYKYTAAAAMFLACKSEEEPRSLKSLVGWVLSPDTPEAAAAAAAAGKTIDSQLANDTRHKILAYEQAMLRVLCFDLTVRHPHWIAVSVARAAWPDPQAERGDMVAKAAWMLLNDSLSAPLCLLYSPPVLAAAAIVLACAQLDVPLPDPPPPLAEQTAQYELEIQEAEEGEETPVFEPRVHWLESVGVHPDELTEPTRDMVDVYRLANDPFVVDEGARLATKLGQVLAQLGPVVPTPGRPASADAPSPPVQAMNLG